MPFRFQDLAITLSTSFEDYGKGLEPKAMVAVAGCGDQSVMMQFGTCAGQTQNPCDKNKDKLFFENGFSKLKESDYDSLKEALRLMLTEVNAALDELKKSKGVVHHRPHLQAPPPPSPPSPAPAPAPKRTSKGKANTKRSDS